MVKKNIIEKQKIITPKLRSQKRVFSWLFYLLLTLLFILFAGGFYIDSETKIAPGSILYPIKTNLETGEYIISQINDTWPLFLRASLVEKRLLELLTLGEALSSNGQNQLLIFQYGDIKNINENINILILKTKTQIEILDNEVRHLPLNTGDSSDDAFDQIRQNVNNLSETRKNILRTVLENNGNNLDENLISKIRNEIDIEIITSPNTNNQQPSFLPKASGPLVPDK